MNRSKIFYWLSISFIGGVGMSSFFEIATVFIFPGLLLAISLLTIFYKNKTVAVVAFFVLFFIAGIGVLQYDLKKNKDLKLVGENIDEKAVIVKEPENKESYQKIIACLGNEKEKILINAPLYPEYFYGDKISVKCVLKIPENRNKSFDYRSYLAKDNIFYICDKATVEKIESGKKGIYASIIGIKNYLDKNIKTSIPQPEAALASGMLFGVTNAMSEYVQDAFSRTGMTHIVAVSGYNVTIIAEYLVLFGIFLGLWRKQALWSAIFGIFIFIGMISFPISALRAGIMGVTLIWAMKNGRLANSLNAVLFAGAVMLFFNPMLLRWDVGFQLSFLSTIGIVLLAPLAEKIILHQHDFFGISQIIFFSICVQVFVWPVIAYNFQSVSLISLLANVLILPVIPVAMLLSFLAAFFGFFLDPNLNIFAWLAYVPLYYEIKMISFLAEFSWASLKIDYFKEVFVVFYYIILGLSVFFIRRNTAIYTKNF